MKKVIFIHIPKTAGSTFRSILKKNYGKRKSFIIHDLNPEISLGYLNKLSESELNKFDLIAGHGAQYLLHRTNQYKSTLYLRDPVRQIISSFYHIKRSPHNVLHDDLKKIHSLHEYHDYLLENGGFNLQTYYLSRSEDDFKLKKRFKKIGEDDYSRALHLMEQVDYVLLTEDFDRSLILLKNETGLSKLNYLSRNISKERSGEENNPELIEKITKAQKWDYQLYEYAEKRYSSLLNKYSDGIDRDLKKFRFKNEIYNKSVGRLEILRQQMDNTLNRFIYKDKKWENKPEYDL